MVAATPMFIADAALGRLATWLRLLGYDTLYARDASVPSSSDSRRAEGRILLTRNTRLVRRRDLPPHVLVAERRLPRTAAPGRRRLRARRRRPRSWSRCSRCNTPLERIEPRRRGASRATCARRRRRSRAARPVRASTGRRPTSNGCAAS